MVNIVAGMSKSAIALELNLTVPQITQQLKQLGLKPYDNNLLTDSQVAALRLMAVKKSEQINDEGENIDLPEIGTEQKTLEQLAAEWGCDRKTISRYINSADAAWRPSESLQHLAVFSPEQVAMILDARNGVKKYRSHDQYIRRRAAWLEQQLEFQKSNSGLSQNTPTNEDEGDIASYFSEATREIEQEFNRALDESLLPIAQEMKRQLSPEALQRRAVGLLVKELAKPLPASEDESFSLGNLFKAAGRVTKRLSPKNLAGLLGAVKDE